MDRSPMPTISSVPDERGDLSFRTVLCPIDFSPGSVAACARALAMTERSGGTLTLLHVVDERRPLRHDVRVVPLENRRLRMAEARARLGMAISSDTLARCQVGIQVTVGATDAQIVAEAGRLGADVIVMGLTTTRGQMPAPPQGGSVLWRVAARAACPVLILSAPADAPEWDAEYDVPGGRHGGLPGSLADGRHGDATRVRRSMSIGRETPW